MQLTKFEKLRFIYTKGEVLFVADLLFCRSFFPEELQLKRKKPTKLPPQNRSATLAHHNQMNPLPH